MPAILHILTRPADDLVQNLIDAQRSLPDTRIIVADLNVPEPDYEALVEQVFEADSVQSW